MAVLKINDIIFDGDNQEYKIIEPIREGGMSYILLIEKKSDSTRFALKTLPQVFMDNSTDYQALLNEGKLTEGIVHQNVLKYVYFHNGEVFQDLPPYIIMDLAEGGNLQEFIEERIKIGDFFEQNDLLNIYFKLIDGMAEINKVIVHRDIKPNNILFKDGEIKITDFGISKIAGDPTRSKSFKGSGTICFLPPEVFLGKENSIRMDIYSMGIVFYILATLKHPYEVRQRLITEDDWRNAHLFMAADSAKRINGQLSSKIAVVIQRMIEKNPAKRFESWDVIRKELEAVGSLEESKHSAIIEKMISKNLDKLTTQQKKESDLLQKEQVEAQKKGMILYQFINDVITPVQEFIQQYNLVSPSPQDKISLTEIISDYSHHKKDSSFRVTTPQSRVDMYIHVIQENDSFSVTEKDLFNEKFIKKYPPKLDGNEILAWGGIENSDGRGLNIVLVKASHEIYGSWYLFENSHSGLSQRRDGRPDPFAFTLDELVKEIQLVKAMHVYNTKITAISTDRIIDFISET